MNPRRSNFYNDTSGGGINFKNGGQLVIAKAASSGADPLVWLNDTAQTTNKFLLFAQDGVEKASIGLAGNDLRFARDGYNETFRIKSDGDASITDGNLIMASGHGIDFSATGDGTNRSSELFDDYEEGSWTPSAGGETINSINSARYTKIGRMVHYQFYINMGASSNTSTWALGGLPFTAASAGQYHYGTGRINGQTFVVLQVNANSTGGHFYYNGSSTIKYNNTANAYILISGVYEAYY